MFSFFNASEKQIFFGNALFVACCGFYLAWWLLAFNPVAGINAGRAGWLLIPAGISGIAAIAITLMGISASVMARRLFPGGYILWGGVAAYIILLAVTVHLFNRPATTELILIVGWCMLALAEINALYGSGVFTGRAAACFISLVCAAVVISLVCYVLYYRLGSSAGYVDGMIPLLLTGLSMTGISGFMVFCK